MARGFTGVVHLPIVAVLMASFAFFKNESMSPSVAAIINAARLVALVSYGVCFWLIPAFQDFLYRRGLKGRDLGRKGGPNELEEMCVIA